MDDNATCHPTLAVQDCPYSEGIQCFVWPARSPDLNPINNVWDALGRQVAGRNYPPTNKNILICALTEEWDKYPQQLLDNVVQIKCHGKNLTSTTRAPEARRKRIKRAHQLAEQIESRNLAQTISTAEGHAQESQEQCNERLQREYHKNKSSRRTRHSHSRTQEQ
ncbi:transposable element Tc1 transposase [Trichonephila clavipes]|nr:transposable element Tc1 transposase [Trichonephila clavipes]